MSIISELVSGGTSGILSSIGTLAKDLRTAITGKEPIDSTKAAELALKAEELVSRIDEGTLAVSLAESQSQDKWTSRGRPLFLYVVYIMILFSIPMGIAYAINPLFSDNIIKGFKLWLQAIPTELYTLFGAGYLGYGAFRSYDKLKGIPK